MPPPSSLRRFVTSSHWGAMEVESNGTEMLTARPFSGDPAPSQIAHILPQAVHHTSRVAQPSFRRAWLEKRERQGRGDGDYIALPWDEALDIAAEEINRIRATHGNDAIYGGSYGWASAGRFHHAQSQIHRFLNSIGGYVSSFGSYSTGCAQGIMPHVFGVPFLKYTYSAQDSWETIAENTETLVMFGGINEKNSQVSMGGVTEHETGGWLRRFVDKGMRCVNVGPQRSDAPDGCDWMRCRPGSDTALMLALAFVLEEEGRTEYDFINRYCVGFERFRPYLIGDLDGQPKSPEWAEEICGVDAEDIRDLAHRMAETRTLITVAWSLQRAEFGEQPYWMSAVLAAMLGQIGLPGGGVGYGYGAIGGIGKYIDGPKGMSLPQGENPIKTFIPVARVADMLLHPGEPYDYNGKRGPYPDIHLVYWAGGNPFHHHQDLNRLHTAWQQPETVIVHEPWWTATAQRADIVFPATTPYEREDIGRSDLDEYLFHMPALVPPQGEARDDYDIFAGLAARMGAGEAFTEGRSSAEWIETLYADFHSRAQEAGQMVPDLTTLRDQNWVKLPTRKADAPPSFLARFRADPEGRPLDTPSGRIEIFSETIDSFGYSDCPGHPIWIAPREWPGAADADTPLHLISPQPGDKLHSQLESALADQPGARPETVTIHPDDAAPRQIETGDLVRLWNTRGACRARAKLSDDILPGVVALPTGAWFSPADAEMDLDGNPNVLTRDIGTSRLGQGSSAHSALVNIEKLPKDAD